MILNYSESTEESLISVDRQKFSLVLQNVVSRAIEVSCENQVVDVFVSVIDVEIPKLATTVNSVNQERRSTTTIRSNRVAAADVHPPAGESDYDREVREEEEKERERDRELENRSVSVFSRNQLLRIGIHDRGPQLNAEQQKQLFEAPKEGQTNVGNAKLSTVDIGLWGE